MAIEAKEVVFYIRKFLLFSIKTGYRTARGHPLISAVVFFVLILYRIFPSLFAFLVTSFPVIICTALLLGTLLSYGTPNIPKIEEANRTTHDVSSMEVGNLVTKKDEKNFTVETSTDVIERTVEEEAGDETARDVPFVRRDDTLLLATSSVDGDNQPDVLGDVGLTVHIAKPTSDNLFDSSLGSPWQPIDSRDASSGSDYDTSGSSSPDASMTDIMPMLDELHPLLDSEHPQASHRSAGYSDSSSDDESDGGTAEEERGKEAAQEEERGGDEDAVTWNADDQKNVMDLGVSELERNRRLESLIEKRRVRKLIRYETEKNLIDLDSYYPTPMPSISAPRRNPFDISYDSVPGSAPSALHRRENPFDLPYDQVERISSFSREYLSHHDFVPSQEKDVFSGSHESPTLGNSYSDDLREEKDDSNPKSYNVDERMGSEGREFTALRRQLSEESDSKSSSESESNSSVTGQEDHNEIGEAAANLPISDSVKSEITEERYEQSNSLTSNEESSEMGGFCEESSNVLRSDTAIDTPVTNPVYDSSPSSVGKTVSNTSSLDEALHYEGKDDIASSSLPSNAQEDFSRNRDYVEVKETVAEESNLSKASSSTSSLDETESRSMEVAEIKEHDDIKVETSKATEDVPETADYITDVHSSIHSSLEAGLEESYSIPKELADDFEFGKEHESAIEPGSQIIEEPDLCNNDDDDALVVSSAIPTQAESTELSTLSKTTLDSSHSEGIKEIDEGLLSELDAVSDFQVSKEIKTDRAETNDVPSHSEDTLRIETEVESSIVHNSTLHALEACPLEELDSVFKQQHEKKFDGDPEVEETDPQLQVQEQKSADLDVAYIETKSHEDIDSAFKQLSEGTVKNPNPPEVTQGEASQRQLETGVSKGTVAADDVSGSTSSISRKKSGLDSSSSSSDSE